MSDDTGVPARTLFSDEELELLRSIAIRRNVSADALVELLDRERQMEHMGRRHGLIQELKLSIQAIATERISEPGTAS